MKIDGIPITEYVVKAAMKTKNINDVILAIPDTKKDIPLYKYFKDKVKIFRGSTENVLERYYNTLNYYYDFIEVDNIIRLTSDCPLLYFHPYIIYKTINYHINNKFDYTNNNGPSGFDVEVMTSNAFLNNYQNAKTDYEREHVTPYLKNNKFKIGHYDCGIDWQGHWSIDTKEDFEKVKEVMECKLKQ
jgi:spore coat polysaccharide biosynthesis protein SpsF